MNENIQKTLSDRNEFKVRLQEDIAKNRENIEKKKDEIEKLSETIKNVNLLGEKPQWDCMIPLGKRIYIPGQIVHTGEYFLEKKSYPYSFSVLTTKEKTLEDLETKKETCEEYLENFQKIEKQLEERIELLSGKDRVCDMPDNIVSDKGVAVRVGEFYEIIEYEESEIK